MYFALIIASALMSGTAFVSTNDSLPRRKSGRLRFSRLEHEPRIYAAAPSGVAVTQVRAFDVDDPNITPLYRLHGDTVTDTSTSATAAAAADSQYFLIHSESGNLTTRRYIDKPQGSVYNLMVVAYVNGDSQYIDIAVHVTEYNKFAPVFRSLNYKADVELIAAAGTEILQVQAFDSDPQPYNSEIYYYVQSRVLNMNRSTGVISLREQLHPSHRTLSVGLLAFDGGSPRRSAKARLTLYVKIISAPRELRVEQTGDQWAMLCWQAPLSGTPLGYIIYLTSSTDFMSSVSSQRNITRAELGSRGGRNCTALTDLESWSDFDARIAGWDRSELGVLSKPLSFHTKVNSCPDGVCNNGECIVTHDPTIMYRCKCEPGYFGLRCNLYDPCYFEPCQNNGTCYNLNNSQFKCSCLTGFYGQDCSQFNPCSSTVSPCLHGGTCTSSESNEYVCSCVTGYQGKSCEMFNPCLQTACKNGGTCENTTSTEFGCTCAPGYTGSTCEAEINECSSNPCYNNGHCVDQLNAFHCICPAGFQGDVCEENIDECASSPCQNQASCVDDVDRYSCTCLPGFTGETCELEMNECSLSPCENNGTCLDRPHAAGGYTCVCSAGFEGDYCEEETNECRSLPCYNGGSCVDLVNNYRCDCAQGYSGRRCELDIDLCADKPCRHGGTCVDLASTVVCHCLPGYHGTYCQLKERCPAEIVPTTKGTFTWAEVEFNTTVHLECPFGMEPNATRSMVEYGRSKVLKKTINKDRPDSGERIVHRLSGSGKPYAERSCVLKSGGLGAAGTGASWGPIIDHFCREEGYSRAEEMCQRLENLTNVPGLMNASVFKEAASHLRQILAYALTDTKIAQGMVRVVSSMMDIHSDMLEQLDEYGTTSLSLIQTLDSFTGLATLTAPSHNLQINSRNIAVDVRFVDRASTTSAKFVPGLLDTTQERNNDFNQVNIEVPPEAIQGASSKDRVRMQFVYFRNGKLFRDPQRNLPTWDTGVLSARLDNVSVSNLSSAVRYSLPLPGRTPQTPTCVYWDVQARQWQSSGVKTRCCRDGWVMCEASHLTAFSVLLDPLPSHPHTDTDSGHLAMLTAISYFGALLSITGLMLTVLTYSMFRCLNRDRSGKILLNLCVSLLFMNVSFLMISVKKHIDSYKVAVALDTCLVVAMLSHYFVLTSLCWMLVEAVNMYQLVIKVFASSETRFIAKRMLFAWGVPLCVVCGTVYYTGLEYYRSESPAEATAQSTAQHPDWCLFSPPSTTVYYLTFVGPASFILTVNIVVFLMVSRVLCQRRNINRNGGQNENGVTSAQVRGAFTVMTLLGVTWIFGVLAIGEFRILFQYLFSAANSLQGFIIFMVRCVQYPEARRAWGRFLRTGQLKSHRGGKNRGTSTRNTSSSSQIRATGTIKGEIAWGGLRSRGNTERMRDLRAEIVRPRPSTNLPRYSASLTLPRQHPPQPSQHPQHPQHQPLPLMSSRSTSLHLHLDLDVEDDSSKEGEDTSWRYMAPSGAGPDQGYGTAEHSPESPRQQPRRQHQPPPTPQQPSQQPPQQPPQQPSPPPAAPATPSGSDITTTGPATSPITSPSPTPSSSPSPSTPTTPSWGRHPPHHITDDPHPLPAKRVHCEQLL